MQYGNKFGNYSKQPKVLRKRGKTKIMKSGKRKTEETREKRKENKKGEETSKQ
jgi:hypothetical protein